MSHELPPEPKPFAEPPERYSGHDFLDLESELTRRRSSQPSPEAEPASLEEESWLLDGEEPLPCAEVTPPPAVEPLPNLAPEEGEGTPSWLLDLNDEDAGAAGSTPVVPEEAVEPEQVRQPVTLEASYCEPEPSTRTVSRAARRGLAVLVVSIVAVGAVQVWRSGQSSEGGGVEQRALELGRSLQGTVELARPEEPGTVSSSESRLVFGSGNPASLARPRDVASTPSTSSAAYAGSIAPASSVADEEDTAAPFELSEDPAATEETALVTLNKLDGLLDSAGQSPGEEQPDPSAAEEPQPDSVPADAGDVTPPTLPAPLRESLAISLAELDPADCAPQSLPPFWIEAPLLTRGWLLRHPLLDPTRRSDPDAEAMVALGAEPAPIALQPSPDSGPEIQPLPDDVVVFVGEEDAVQPEEALGALAEADDSAPFAWWEEEEELALHEEEPLALAVVDPFVTDLEVVVAAESPQEITTDEVEQTAADEWSAPPASPDPEYVADAPRFERMIVPPTEEALRSRDVAPVTDAVPPRVALAPEDAVEGDLDQSGEWNLGGISVEPMEAAPTDPVAVVEEETTPEPTPEPVLESEPVAVVVDSEEAPDSLDLGPVTDAVPLHVILAPEDAEEADLDPTEEWDLGEHSGEPEEHRLGDPVAVVEEEPDLEPTPEPVLDSEPVALEVDPQEAPGSGDLGSVTDALPPEVALAPDVAVENDLDRSGEWNLGGISVEPQEEALVDPFAVAEEEPTPEPNPEPSPEPALDSESVALDVESGEPEAAIAADPTAVAEAQPAPGPVVDAEPAVEGWVPEDWELSDPVPFEAFVQPESSGDSTGADPVASVEEDPATPIFPGPLPTEGSGTGGFEPGDLAVDELPPPAPLAVEPSGPEPSEEAVTLDEFTALDAIPEPQPAADVVAQRERAPSNLLGGERSLFEQYGAFLSTGRAPSAAPEMTVDPVPGPTTPPVGASDTSPQEPIAVADPAPVVVPAEREGALKRAGSDGRWLSDEVPLEALEGDKRVMTPNVGRVRVVFNGGGSMEGELHSIGQKQVWIDTNSGRITLDGRRVKTVERLDSSVSTAKSGETDYTRKPRVRVSTQGGVFVGHLIHREGRQVTLMTDEGLRITLESDDVQPANTRRSTVGIRKRQ